MSQTRIGRLFERLRTTERRPALIAYITAGDPSPDRTPELVAALERGGADLIELGVPFSDPIADGPVIQRGSDRALKAGTRVSTVLDIAAEIRKRSEIPLLLFTYMNPVLHYGLEALARDAATRGIDGCLLTDLSVEEAEPYVGAMRNAGLDTVFLDLVELEVRELLKAYQFPGDDLPVVRLSALGALNGDAKWEEQIRSEEQKTELQPL